jgi:hypothetical protein
MNWDSNPIISNKNNIMYIQSNINMFFYVKSKDKRTSFSKESSGICFQKITINFLFFFVIFLHFFFLLKKSKKKVQLK